MRERLLAVLEPVVEGLGYELVELEFKAGAGVLRIFIDRPEPGDEEEGVTLDDCERVSHQVSAVLDVEDPIPGAYNLEISSPGLERPLRKPAHYERFLGERAKVELAVPQDGRKRYTGFLRSVEDGHLVIEVDGQEHRLPLGDIERARLAPQF